MRGRKEKMWLWTWFVLLVGMAVGDPFAWESYHRTEDIVSWLELASVQHPNRLKLEKVQAEDDPLELPVVTITDYEAPEDDKVDVMMVFGEHARELISAEVGLWLVRTLLGESDAIEEGNEVSDALGRFFPEERRPESFGAWASALLKHVRFTIVAVENPSMRQAVERGEYCLRGNARGNDLNRNWPFHWDNTTTSGTAPLSEPESRIILKVAEGLSNLQAYVAVHSGEYAVYYPWDHTMVEPIGIPAGMGELMSSLSGQCVCNAGPGGKTATYLAFGTSMDYFFKELKVPYSLTFEVYGRSGDGLKPQHGWPVVEDRGSFLTGKERCLREFNPENGQLYKEVVVRWVASLLKVADHVAREGGSSVDVQKSSRTSDFPSTWGSVLGKFSPTMVGLHCESRSNVLALCKAH